MDRSLRDRHCPSTATAVETLIKELYCHMSIISVRRPFAVIEQMALWKSPLRAVMICGGVTSTSEARGREYHLGHLRPPLPETGPRQGWPTGCVVDRIIVVFLLFNKRMDYI